MGVEEFKESIKQRDELDYSSRTPTLRGLLVRI
jgi:hypothetical protein